MSPPKVSTSFAVTWLFAVAGAGLAKAFLSLGLIDMVFYTTKPSFFLQSWHLLLFIALFAISFSLIPLAAGRSRPGRLVWLLAAWVGTTLLTAFIVSVTTAIVHHQTLGIPDGLVPVGLLAIPVVSGVTVIVISRFWRVSPQPPGKSRDALRKG